MTAASRVARQVQNATLVEETLVDCGQQLFDFADQLKTTA